MHSTLVVAATLASVAAAQSSGAAAAATPNAFNIPSAGMPAASAGGPGSVAWNTAGGNGKGVALYAVAGPSTDLKTVATLFRASDNPGTATWTWPSDIPSSGVALKIVETGITSPNYSPQFDVAGGTGEASPAASASASGSASATQTGSAASTLETVASTTGSEATATPAVISSNSTIASNATALTTQSSSEPTATGSTTLESTETATGSKSATSATGTSAATTFKVSFAVLFGGLAAAVFAL